MKAAPPCPSHLNKVLRMQHADGWWDWNGLHREDGPGLGWNRPRMEKIVRDCLGRDRCADNRLAATVAVLLKIKQCYAQFQESFELAQTRAVGWLGRSLSLEVRQMNELLYVTLKALRERPFVTTYNQRRYLRCNGRWIDAALNVAAPTAIADMLESRFRRGEIG